MTSTREFALHLGIPLILVQAALLDGVLDALIADQLAPLKPNNLDEDKRATLKEALEVAC
ncbi:MAG TPA: hypothetical protein VEB03_01915 [Candidatus Nanoarchaeia archaeon]|nr:hypothetical protein [Candidatus Nanoarchaeia archaeon]